ITGVFHQQQCGRIDDVPGGSSQGQQHNNIAIGKQLIEFHARRAEPAFLFQGQLERICVVDIDFEWGQEMCQSMAEFAHADNSDSAALQSAAVQNGTPASKATTANQLIAGKNIAGDSQN